MAKNLADTMVGVCYRPPNHEGAEEKSVEQFGCKGKQVGSHFGYYYLHNRTT